jgi:hypothetical protein
MGNDSDVFFECFLLNTSEIPHIPSNHTLLSGFNILKRAVTCNVL